MLVIDDDLLLRKLVATELVPEFEVVSCRDVQEALVALDGPGGVAAVVADLHLGSGPSGINLLTYVRSLMLGCRRVLVSTTNSKEVQDALDRGIAHVFIRKPWSRGELLAAVANRTPVGGPDER